MYYKGTPLVLGTCMYLLFSSTRKKIVPVEFRGFPQHSLYLRVSGCVFGAAQEWRLQIPQLSGFVARKTIGLLRAVF